MSCKMQGERVLGTLKGALCNAKSIVFVFKMKPYLGLYREGLDIVPLKSQVC